MPFTKKPHSFQTRVEEAANSISHGIGLAGAVIAAPFLITSTSSDVWTVIGASVFISTAIVLYLSSTLYHSFQSEKLKKIFQIIDHAAIFLLIAGTHTALALGVLRETWGWTLFGLAWGVALTGIIIKVIVGPGYMKLFTAFYVAMGLLILIAVKPLLAAGQLSATIWLIAGGLAYILGIFFYMIPNIRFTHFVWHLFVLAGTSCHFVAVMQYAV